MTILAAPVLTSVADAEHASGERLTVGLTPGVTGAVTRVYYRLRGASSWTLGATVTGTAGTPTSTTLTGLTPQSVYEVIAWTDDGTDASPPSIALRGIPTDGTGSILDRALENLQAALMGITIADGYDWDMARVYREAPNASRSRSSEFPHAYLQFIQADTEDHSSIGGQGLQQSPAKVRIVMIACERTGDRDFPEQEGLRMHDAVIRAVLEDYTRAGIAVDTRPTSMQLFHRGEDFPYAGVVVELDLLARWKRDNPSQREGQ